VKLPKASAEVVQRFEALLPDGPEVTRRLVFGSPAAFVRGNMFFGVFGESLFVRLPEEDRREAMRSDGALPFEPMKGRVMGGYVVLPGPVVENEGRAQAWVDRAHRWVATLPPKEPGRRGSSPPQGRQRPTTTPARRAER